MSSNEIKPIIIRSLQKQVAVYVDEILSMSYKTDKLIGYYQQFDWLNFHSLMITLKMRIEYIRGKLRRANRIIQQEESTGEIPEYLSESIAITKQLIEENLLILSQKEMFLQSFKNSGDAINTNGLIAQDLENKEKIVRLEAELKKLLLVGKEGKDEKET